MVDCDIIKNGVDKDVKGSTVLFCLKKYPLKNRRSIHTGGKIPVFNVFPPPLKKQNKQIKKQTSVCRIGKSDGFVNLKKGAGKR